MFRIKICGITNVDDARAAADAGAGAIGLNFYLGSPRCVPLDEAVRIEKVMSPEMDRVGVFVNASVEEIRQSCKTARIHTIQLHGNEPPEMLGKLNKDFDIIRARRLDKRGFDGIIEDFAACCIAAGFGPDAILVDAAVDGAFGGTGQSADWEQLSHRKDWVRGWPLILAGGLTPHNVAEAIRIVRPDAVDVASGVESAPGKKDAAKMRAFVAAARGAFSQL